MKKLLLIVVSFFVAHISLQTNAWPNNGFGSSPATSKAKTDDSDNVTDQQLINGRMNACIALATFTAVCTAPFGLKAAGFTLQSDKTYSVGRGLTIAWLVACIPTFIASAWYTFGNLGNEFTAHDTQTSALYKTLAVVLALGTVGGLPGGYFASQC